jgi:hypothetical protein
MIPHPNTHNLPQLTPPNTLTHTPQHTHTQNPTHLRIHTRTHSHRRKEEAVLEKGRNSDKLSDQPLLFPRSRVVALMRQGAEG